MLDTQGRDLQGAQRGDEPVQGGVRPRDRAPARWRTRSRARTSSSASPAKGLLDPVVAEAHERRTRSSSPWPTPIRRSPTRTPWPRARTSSWPPGAPTIRTRSTTSSASPSSSAARWTAAPPPSTRQMKMAATHALADLAKQDVPDSVSKAYGDQFFHFGREYLIPKPFDSRVLVWEAAAVARAAMETGVARKPLDLDEYRERLESLLGQDPRRHAHDHQQGAQRARSGSSTRKGRTSASSAPPPWCARRGWPSRSSSAGREVIEENCRELDLDLGDTVIIDPEQRSALRGLRAGVLPAAAAQGGDPGRRAHRHARSRTTSAP